ncbi:MAG: putative toxin-antitoxin system toxin component, PIN family [Dysgonamonadaceae bacterium]|jgi:putative PIN family toxin of toxin-antitoxin system|nr:putative toxin-antitoxin system toxin component, PIN family [Dysgonamonadaceae bacterium]
MKIILDSNIWISFAIGKRLLELEYVFNQSDICIYTCYQLHREVNVTLQKPKLQKYISIERRKVLLDYMATCPTAIIEAQTTHCRDPKDNFLLSLAQTVRADFLITGDNDLLVLKRHFSTVIVSFNDFISLLR